MRQFLLALMMILLAVVSAKSGTLSSTQSVSPTQLTQEDATLILESFHLWKSLGDKLWPGWTHTPMPVIYVTQDYEYAIDFPKTLRGSHRVHFEFLPDKKIDARKRTFQIDVAGTQDVEGVNTVVVGRPAAVGRYAGEWTLMVTHEMFHVWQLSRGSHAKVAALKIGPEVDASWQVNYPFPYKDADVMRLIHLQSYLTYLAVTSPDEETMNYNAGTVAEAVAVYRTFLTKQDSTGNSYDYSRFQEWVEGIAFYTEYKMAEEAAQNTYSPTEGFGRLPNFKSYPQLWSDNFQNRIFLAKHAGRAARSRTAFYHIGLGKGLLLDRLMPGWKARYFDPNVWLDDLLSSALT